MGVGLLTGGRVCAGEGGGGKGGRISHLEYLLWLNLFAGRQLGDRRAHAFVPWVIDFTEEPRRDDMEGRWFRGVWTRVGAPVYGVGFVVGVHMAGCGGLHW